jgi:hypothetical protein
MFKRKMDLPIINMQRAGGLFLRVRFQIKHCGINSARFYISAHPLGK